MVKFLNTHCSLKTRRRIYRFLFTLSQMNFFFLLPVTFGALFFFLALFGMVAPESAKMSVSQGKVIAYFIVLFTNLFFFLLTLRPLVRKLIGKIRVYLYRRKKRAYTGFLLR